MNEKDDLEKKRKFTTPEQIKFAKKVAPKTLPESEQQTPPKIPQKPIKLNLSPQGPSGGAKKLTLRPEDIKISLKSKIEKIKKDRKKLTVKSAIQESPQPETLQADVDTTQNVADVEPVEYPEHDVNLTDVIMTFGEFNFAKELRNLIKRYGSDLNDKLCEQYVNEMLETLEIALTYEDLKYAADIFVNIEKSLLN